MPKPGRPQVSYYAESLDAEESLSDEDSTRSTLEAIAGRWLYQKMTAMRRNRAGLLVIVVIDWTIITAALDFQVCGKLRIWGFGAAVPLEADVDTFSLLWPVAVLYFCLVFVITVQMSLWNFFLVKRVLKEPYAILTILEATGFCLSYGATFCWRPDACAVAISLWVAMLTACFYDTLSVKARVQFRWVGAIFVAVLQFICFCLVFRTTPSICVSSKFWDYSGNSGSSTASGGCLSQPSTVNITSVADPPAIHTSWDLVDALGLNYIDLTLGYAGSVTLLFLRMLFLAFGKGPARCCLITCPIKVSIVQKSPEILQSDTIMQNSSWLNTQEAKAAQDDRQRHLGAETSNFCGPPPSIEDSKLLVVVAPRPKTFSLDAGTLHGSERSLIPLRIRQMSAKESVVEERHSANSSSMRAQISSCLRDYSSFSRERVTKGVILMAQRFLAIICLNMSSARRLSAELLPFGRRTTVFPEGKRATLVIVHPSHSSSIHSDSSPHRADAENLERKEDTTIYTEPKSALKPALAERSTTDRSTMKKKQNILRRKLVSHFTRFELSSQSKDRLVCLCFGETLGLTYLHWRYRWKAVIEPISLISHFACSIAPFTIILSGPQAKNVLWLVPFLTSLITLENSMALFNSSVIKNNLRSFDFWFISVKAGFMLTALSGIFCWEPTYALFYFGNLGGMFGTLSRDAVPFRLRRSLRFSTLTTVCGVGFIVAVVYYGAVQESYCLNDRFGALRWLRLAGMSNPSSGSTSANSNCSSSSSSIGTDITPWHSLRSSTTWTDRVLTMTLSWREMLLSNSMTYLFLCVNYVLSDMWFQDRFAVVVAPTSLVETRVPLLQEKESH